MKNLSEFLFGKQINTILLKLTNNISN